MEDNKFEIGNDYVASHMQLRELFRSIIDGDIGSCSYMLKLFENQKLERLRKDREDAEFEKRRQEIIETQKIESDIE